MRTLSDDERLASIREALRAANGDWHETTRLLSVCDDLDWLLARASGVTAPDPASDRLRAAAKRLDTAIIDAAAAQVIRVTWLTDEATEYLAALSDLRDILATPREAWEARHRPASRPPLAAEGLAGLLRDLFPAAERVRWPFAAAGRLDAAYDVRDAGTPTLDAEREP